MAYFFIKTSKQAIRTSTYPQHTRIYEEIVKIIFQLSSNYALYSSACLSNTGLEDRNRGCSIFDFSDLFSFLFFWLFVRLTKVVCIDIALCVIVHDVEISPSLTTNNRWYSQSFEMNDAWKTVDHSIRGITHISDKIFRCS